MKKPSIGFDERNRQMNGSHSLFGSSAMDTPVSSSSANDSRSRQRLSYN